MDPKTHYSDWITVLGKSNNVVSVAREILGHDEKKKNPLHNRLSTRAQKYQKAFWKHLADFPHSLQHLLGSVAAQVAGHRVNAVQGRLHVQASNKIFGAVLVEVKGQLRHICSLLRVALAKLIAVLAVL